MRARSERLLSCLGRRWRPLARRARRGSAVPHSGSVLTRPSREARNAPRRDPRAGGDGGRRRDQPGVSRQLRTVAPHPVDRAKAIEPRRPRPTGAEALPARGLSARTPDLAAAARPRRARPSGSDARAWACEPAKRVLSERHETALVRRANQMRARGAKVAVLAGLVAGGVALAAESQLVTTVALGATLVLLPAALLIELVWRGNLTRAGGVKTLHVVGLFVCGVLVFADEQTLAAIAIGATVVLLFAIGYVEGHFR